MTGVARTGFAAATLLLLMSCATRSPERGGPAPPSGRSQTGLASWYGPDFHGRTTASGERYNMLGLSAAHRTLAFGTYVRVVNKVNGRTLVVRINDRGPFVRGRIIDLSYAAAKVLDMTRAGVVEVRIEPLSQSDGSVVHRRQQELVAGEGIRSWSDAEYARLRRADRVGQDEKRTR